MHENFELDEFWSDCMNKPYLTKSQKDLFLNSNSTDSNTHKNQKRNSYENKNNFLRKKMPKYISLNDNEADYAKSKLISNTQSSQYDLKNIKEALIKEELIPLIKYKKEEKTNKIFINLYKKDKLSKELWEKNNNKQKEKKERLKISECTFKPKKCNNKKLENKINKLYKNSNIYERNLKYQQKYNEKIAFLFNETNKIYNNCTSSECYFHPNINENKNIDKLFNNENNIWKSHADNDSTKLFYLRYMRAREEEFDKKEKLNSPVNKNLKYNFTYPKRMIRNLSQKDSLILRKNLHNTLYSYKNLFTEEEDEKNDDNKTFEENKDEKNEKDNNNKINVNENNSDNLQWTFAKKNNN